MTPHPLLHAFAPPAKPESEMINIVGGRGSTVYDDQGRGYIDGLASLWYCQIGHGRAEMADAVASQMRQLEAFHTFDPFTNPCASRAAEMVVERSAMPDGRVLFGCTGSDAVDTALKIARLYARMHDSDERQLIIKRTNGYHGTNFGGTSAQGITPNREGWGDLVPHFVEVPNDDLEAVASVLADQGNRVAAVLAEPVQGAGGVFPPLDGYLQGLRRLCDQHGALLIFDEVISGFGRTGEWFGAQTFGVTPDLTTFAKGVTSGYLPLSGVIVGRKVCDVLEAPGLLLRTGYTYSGHPTSAVAAIKNLEIIDDEDLVARAKHVGSRLVEGLEALAADGLIASHRGVGAVHAAVLDRPAAPVRDEMLRRSVILRPIDNALAICPPLVITDDEIGRLIDAMAESLKAV